MRKVGYFTIIFLLIISLIGCSSSKNEALKTNEVVTNKNVNEIDDTSNWKIYRYVEYGYEVNYPQNYNVVLSGGHSVVANPELGMRLSLFSKDNQIVLDIDSIDKVNYRDKYQNVEDYIKYKHLNIKFDEDIIINDKKNKVYKLEDDNYYFSFFENEKYIFQLSSNSKEVLKKVMMTFRFS